MPVDQLTRRTAAIPGDAKLVQYDRYIDAQIQSTRRRVKLVDLATALVSLATVVVAFLLAVALIEHWLLPGGFSRVVRTLLFAALAGGFAWFAYRRLWPLFARAINPVYAAQTIEESSPSLKNTLVNLLLFRQRRTEISDAVYHTLEEQAAQRLTRVPVDAAVDRANLIRLGYVLLGVVILMAIYAIVSPKNPFITAERVLMPWADIVPASRVRIEAIEPGAVTLARGEFLNVSAEVRGISDSDPVVLRYTTADGQALDKAIPLSPTGIGQRFECRLPAADGVSGRLGLSQNLTYRIEAGDARSLDYSVKVVPAPSILVERIDFDYPDYTGEPDHSVKELGNIRAIEGTRVTIHARANGHIREAAVDFDADGSRDRPMTSEGAAATASFILELRPDRKSPKYASYSIRFANVDGWENRNPVKYPIEVIRDLDPEVAIVAPPEKTRDVRLDETVLIEIDARDPDFALADVRLRGETIGRPNIDERLLAIKHTGAFSGRYPFTPSEHQLRPGDVVSYWATAGDVRTPEANSAATERRTFRIVANPAQKPPQDRDPQNNGARGQQGNQDQPGQKGGEPQAGQPQGGRGGEAQPGRRDGEPQGQGAGGESDSADGARGQRGGAQGQRGGAERNDNQKQQPGDLGQSGDSQSQPGGANKQQGSEGQTRNQNQTGNQNQEQTGAGAAGGESTQKGSQPDGARPDTGNNSKTQPSGNRGDRGTQSSDGNRGPNGDGRRGGSADKPESVSSDGDNDAEAIKRIERHLKETGEIKEEPQSDTSDSPDAKTQSGDSSAANGKSDGKQPTPGERGNRSGDPNSKSAPSGQDQRTREGERGQPPGQRGQPTPRGDQSPNERGSGAPGDRKDDAIGEPGKDPLKQNRDSVNPKEQTPRSGAGEEGQNAPANEGAGRSGQPGPGSDSEKAGGDTKSEDPTGQSSRGTPGRGSATREGRGDRAGRRGTADDNAARGASDAGDNSKGGDADQSTKEGQGTAGRRGEPGARSERGNRADGNRAGGPSGNAGENGTGNNPAPQSNESAPEGDPANLEYARKQTDLVLEKLSDQLNRKKVDDQLLKGLGWSEDDLRKFVERWKQRKDAAQRTDPAGDAARRELDDALRSLGLQPGGLRQSQVKDDKDRNLQPGYRGAVPPELQQRLREYNRGVSRAAEK